MKRRIGNSYRRFSSTPLSQKSFRMVITIKQFINKKNPLQKRGFQYIKTISYIYASIGAQVQTKFRSPKASSTRETVAKNLWSRTQSKG